MCELAPFISINPGQLHQHIHLVYKEKKVWRCINSLQCFARWGWTGAEGMDGCPGPTAARRRGTEHPSVWGTLHLLCPAHSPFDTTLPFVLSAETIQVSPDGSSRLPTQHLTASQRAEAMVEALGLLLRGWWKLKQTRGSWDFSIPGFRKWVYSVS